MNSKLQDYTFNEDFVKNASEFLFERSDFLQNEQFEREIVEFITNPSVNNVYKAIFGIDTHELNLNLKMRKKISSEYKNIKEYRERFKFISDATIAIINKMNSIFQEYFTIPEKKQEKWLANSKREVGKIALKAVDTISFQAPLIFENGEQFKNAKKDAAIRAMDFTQYIIDKKMPEAKDSFKNLNPTKALEYEPVGTNPKYAGKWVGKYEEPKGLPYTDKFNRG